MIRSMHWLVLLGLALASTAVLAVQHSDDNAEGIVWGNPLRTADEVLAEAGLSASNPELLEALNDTRPRVRVAAANKLLEKSDNSEIPEDEKRVVVSTLHASLLVERDEFVMISIAYVLARFGHRSGLNRLRSVARTSHNQELRMGAARCLVILGETRLAYDVTLDVLQGSASLSAQMAAAAMLSDTRFHGVVDEEIVNAAANLLASHDFSLRNAISYGLWRAGECSVMPRLKELYETEKDDEIRKDIRETIARLECSGVAHDEEESQDPA